MQKSNERDFEEVYSRCFKDLGIKTVSGIMLGTLLSSFFLRNARWPAILGGSFGVGLSYVRCEQSLNEYVRNANAKPCFLK
ncbi:MICOS complex subunit Mic10-like [Aricia agestis]|uniref:MICOS complex subunit Mic10-like n=1 Tax=Aricia agestis TaxID=91739 RepID=UPI001C20B17D|nr:MICOS complex subunit Mic10-like [Aricia agestis]